MELPKRLSREVEVLVKRWAVERTFGWLNCHRQLSKDYELYIENSGAMIYSALIRIMLRRIVS